MKRDNIEIMVRISVKDNTHYPIKEATTIVDAEERTIISDDISGITGRLLVMVDSVRSKIGEELDRIYLADEKASTEEKPAVTQIIPTGDSVNMESIAKNAAGIV
jgi:DNA/RNA-binding domain of Phe-tRNA-synthetase-like protein